MEKTPFAGLTRLNPNESLSTDGGSFVDQNPARTDYFLELALTHRHDGSPALANPAGSASASVANTGGSIPADVSLYLGYTLLDARGGETELSGVDSISTQPAYDAPSSAPIAAVEYGTGSILIGSYYYAITLLDDAGGETPPSPWTQVDREPGDANAQVNLSGLTADFADTGAIAWRLYRSKPGSHFDLLAEGNTDTYTDDGTTPVDCDVHPPLDSSNTTNGANVVNVEIIDIGAPEAAATQFRLYASLDGTFTSPCLVGTYAIADIGDPITIASLSFLRGAPPDVATAKGGLSKIDPDTEILDWHWKRPVDEIGDLPVGSGTTAGDARMVMGEGMIFGFYGDPEEWHPLGTVTDDMAGAADLWLMEQSGEFAASGFTRLRFYAYGGPDVGVVVDDEGGGSAAVGYFQPNEGISAFQLEGPNGQGYYWIVEGTDGIAVTVESPLDEGDLPEFLQGQELSVARMVISGSGIAGETGASGVPGPPGDNVIDVALDEDTGFSTERLEFHAGPGVEVVVTDEGGGTTRVEVSASGAGGGGGGGGPQYFVSATDAEDATSDGTDPGVIFEQIDLDLAEDSTVIIHCRFEGKSDGGLSAFYTVEIDGATLGVGSAPGNGSTEGATGQTSYKWFYLGNGGGGAWNAEVTESAKATLSGGEGQVYVLPAGAHTITLRGGYNGTNGLFVKNRRLTALVYPG